MNTNNLHRPNSTQKRIAIQLTPHAPVILEILISEKGKPVGFVAISSCIEMLDNGVCSAGTWTIGGDIYGTFVT